MKWNARKSHWLCIDRKSPTYRHYFSEGVACARILRPKSHQDEGKGRERESKKPYRFYFNDVVRCGWCWCWNSTVNGGKFAMWKCARALVIFTVTLDFSCLGIAWVACKWKKTGECESDNQEFMALVRLWFNACLFRTQFSNNMWGHDFFSFHFAFNKWHWILLQSRSLTVAILILVLCWLTSVFNLKVSRSSYKKHAVFCSSLCHSWEKRWQIMRIHSDSSSA